MTKRVQKWRAKGGERRGSRLGCQISEDKNGGGKQWGQIQRAKRKKECGTNTGAKPESKKGQIFMGRNDAKYFGQKLSSMFENKSLF